MPTYFNEEGQAVEAFTPEEVEEKLEEARREAIEEARYQKQEEVEETNALLKEKEEELEELRAELESEKSKDKNLVGQRKVIESKQEEIKKLQATMEELKTETEKKLQEIEMKGKDKLVSGMISELAGSDKDLSDKIKFHYDSFKGDANTEEEVKERIGNAYILATGTKPSKGLSGSIISSSGNTPTISDAGKINSDVQETARKLGITDQELKKHKLV